VGWIFISTMPDHYDASAKVHVDTESMLRPLLRGLAVDSDITGQVQSITRTLLSRPNLEKLVRKTDLDLKVKSKFEMDAMVSQLQARIGFRRLGQENLFEITFTDSNPKLAKDVVQAVLDIFVESSLGTSRQGSNVAQEFIDQQIEEYRKKLFESEEKLKEFKQANVGLMPSQGQDYFARLQQEEEELARARLLYDEAKQRRDELRRQLIGEEPSFGIMPSSTVSNAVAHPLDSRIQELEIQIDNLLLRFTEQHPDVVELRKMVSRLKKQRDEDLAKLDKKGNAPANLGLEQNPVYQQIKISLGSAEAELASLSVRVEQLEARTKKTKELVDTVPKIEAELARLDRDYNVNRQNYDALVARRESARLSREAGRSADNIKFRIIEPPRVPNAPSGPNRPLLQFVVLIGGLLVGISFAFLIAQIKPIFFTVKTLKGFSDYPVLGAVSIVRTEKQLKLRRLEVLSFLAVGMVLLLGYILMVVNSFVLPTSISL
jgi:polysaccharide chain length determinant protein (PEP-CTERM system associated)